MKRLILSLKRYGKYLLLEAKMKLLLQLVLLVTSLNCLSQPYSGTIFVDSDIIIRSDSSAFVSATYVGQDFKTIFDRRVDDWIMVNAYLFEIVWNDGINSEAVVNPEFENVETALLEAEKYGRSIGQLPNCLRVDVNEIWINKGVEPFGGGNNSILIHTGQSVLYENQGIMEETLVHEACHTSLDAMHANSMDWNDAQVHDGGFISDYAEQFPDREDIAESFLMWMAVRYRESRVSPEDFKLITDKIPNRLKYFDELECDLFPFQIQNTTIINELEKERNKVQVFPNPTQGLIQLEHNDVDIQSGKIYNSLGKVVLETKLSGRQTINLSDCISGIYYLVLHKKDGTLIGKRIIKE